MNASAFIHDSTTGQVTDLDRGVGYAVNASGVLAS
jgi:hypothetical protein